MIDRADETFQLLQEERVTFKIRERFAQHFDARGEYFAKGLLLPAVARRLTGVGGCRPGNVDDCIAGHMSKLSDCRGTKQAWL